MSDSRTAALCFGRYNPPTYGHLLLWTKLSEAPADDKFIYASHSQDKKKNPLSYATKYALIKYIIKSKGLDAEFVKSDARTIMEAVLDLYRKGYTDILIVAGSDRIDDLKGLVSRYNGVPLNKNGDMYQFDSIKGINAGDRDPDADDITGMSASKVRKFALDGDFEDFHRSIPIEDEMIAQSIYDEIREVML
jgi:hypothetical protein